LKRDFLTGGGVGVAAADRLVLARSISALMSGVIGSLLWVWLNFKLILIDDLLTEDSWGGCSVGLAWTLLLAILLLLLPEASVAWRFDAYEEAAAATLL